MRDRASPSRWLLPTLAVLFFGSGASALIYQVLWLRLLGLVFGVTVYAASTVWASFMAGLAIGSLVAGRLSDRVRRPLVWFGACEVLIGATALATPLALESLQQVYLRIYPSLPESLPVLTLVRFVIAFVVLIVPTALMGATLPLVIKSSAWRTSDVGERIGVLYGTNTAGAIVGTIAAGLFLIPGRGIHGTFLVAAGINVLVGVAAMAFGVRLKPDTSAGDLKIAPTTVDQQIAQKPVGANFSSHEAPVGANFSSHEAPALTESQLHIVLWVFALSGLTSLGLEVVWFRVLTLFLRPTVYGFAIMLATILAGIAVGSYLITPRLDRRWRWLSVLAGLELAIGMAAVLSFGPLARMAALTTDVRPLLARIVPDYLVYLIVSSVLAIFPTALLLGVAFPIGLRLWAQRGHAGGPVAGNRIGSFYSLNVAGSILGSLLTGFVLLPELGSRSSLIALAALSFGSGLLLLAISEVRRGTRLLVGVVASALFVAAVLASPDPLEQFAADRYPRQRMVWKKEGVASTVVVHAAEGGELSLSLNGNHQASTGPAMVYSHHRIGHLPMALHPNATEALVIGLGGGATAGAVSIHRGVDVDVVELAEEVADGAAYFNSINHHVLSRPNVHLRIDDGRNFLMVTPRRYDVVTADVILPIYAGSGNLYSAEYFQLIRRVLKPGGLVLQWVAGTEAEYKLIARTFLSVFPQTTAWVDGTLLVGTVEPLQLRRRDFEWKLKEPGRAMGLKDLEVESFDQLLSLFRAGPDELRAFVGLGQVLTDDAPLVEYFLSLPRDRDADLSTLKGDVRRYVAEH